MGKDYRRPTEQDIDLLVWHLLRVPQVIQAALPVLKVEHFTQVVERQEALLWAISKDYYTTYHAPVPEMIVVSEIQKRTAGSSDFDNETIQKLFNRVARYYRTWRDMAPCVDYTMDVLSAYLFYKHVFDELQVGFRSGNATPEMINKILEKSKTVELSSPMVVEPFALDGDDNLAITPRSPIGVSFLDELLDGGARAGEAYGFIAPTGGGKTTLSNQVAISHAARGNHVYVFTYEQPPDNDYLLPVRVCASQIPRDRFKSVRKISDFTEEERLKYIRAKETIDKFLHFVDFSGTGANPNAGSGGVEEVARTLHDYARRGMPASAFIIDWFWPEVTRSGPEDESQMRQHATSELVSFKQLAGQIKGWCWINQQLTAADAGKRKVPEWNQAAELKSFANYLDFCFTLGALDGQKMGKIKSSKARGNAVLEYTVQLDGRMAMFKGIDYAVIMDKRTQQWTRADQLKKIPTDRIPTTQTETRDDYGGQVEA